MSTLYKNPTINEVIGEIAAAKTTQVDYIDKFLDILNGVEKNTVSFDTAGIYANLLPASTTNKINKAYIYFNNPNPRLGMLFLRNNKDSNYWFISLDKPTCTIYKLSPGKTVPLSDCLSVFEIRETIKQNGGTGGESEWERAIKPHLVYAPAQGEETVAKIECGTNLEVDGSIYLNESFDFYNSYGDHLTLVPKPENADLNKILHVGTMGPAWVNPTGGGTQLYMHKFWKSNSNYAIIISQKNISSSEDFSWYLTSGDFVVGYLRGDYGSGMIIEAIKDSGPISSYFFNALTGSSALFQIDEVTHTVIQL